MDTFEGLTGTFNLYDDRVVLIRGKKFGNFEKSIYLRDIIEVQLNKPGLSRPMLAISTAVDGSGMGVLNYMSMQSNVIVFKTKQWDEAVEFKRLIEEAAAIAKRSASGGVSNSASNGSADEILKYKQLLDAGAITLDEFEAKKKQLLGI